MNELIKIELNENQEPIISGRELHEKLEIGQHYRDWIKRMLEFGFNENEDYTPHIFVHPQNKQETSDILMKLDMAKEICMLQRNDKGKMFRQYFIQVEKDYNSPEKIMARALMIADKKIKVLDLKIDQLEQKIEKDKSKVIFAEALEVSNTSILIGQLAKLIKQNGVEIGANRLFDWLRKHGYLGTRGEYYNVPTQKSMELGIMEIKTTTSVNPDGSVRTNRTPKITGKGQTYFVNKFLNDKEVG